MLGKQCTKSLSHFLCACDEQTDASLFPQLQKMRFRSKFGLSFPPRSRKSNRSLVRNARSKWALSPKSDRVRFTSPLRGARDRATRRATETRTTLTECPLFLAQRYARIETDCEKRGARCLELQMKNHQKVGGALLATAVVALLSAAAGTSAQMTA